MTLSQFDNGYWYATELRDFAQRIGLPAANKLRKDELEKSIKVFLQTGSLKLPTKRNLAITGTKDVERGLTLELPVVVYTNDKETKNFLEREAQKLVPGLKRKSGARYRLNRWREEHLTQGKKITYGDVVKEYIRLNQTTEAFAKIPQDCYVNFMSEFLAGEEGATREQAIAAWKKLKQLDIPKNYRSWVQYQRARRAR